MPEELEGLDSLLSDTYFCNFSLFQSMPDSWAIKQLFPVMPIHRLNERPTRHAVLGDITCDSDGKIDQFIDRRDVKRTLPLHQFDRRAVLPRRVSDRRLSGNPRRLAQPVWRHERRAREPRTPTARSCCEHVIKGDTVREVLDYVEFEPDSLTRQLRDCGRSRRPRRPHRLRGSRPVSEVLRRRPARLHVSGRAGRRSKMKQLIMDNGQLTVEI